MASIVEICNLALSNIRARSINSLDEASLEAQQCSLKYEFVRNRVLSEIPWSFNRKIAALALTTEDIYNWAYAYSYPSDCLKINRLVGGYEALSNADASIISRFTDSELLSLSELRSRIPHEIFNVDNVKLICANESDLYIDYAAKITDPNLFSPDFIMALSHLLAAEIAIPIVGVENGRELRKDSFELYTAYLDSAVATDGNEDYMQPGPSEFETVRR